jgi:hypothetical protein
MQEIDGIVLGLQADGAAILAVPQTKCVIDDTELDEQCNPRRTRNLSAIRCDGIEYYSDFALLTGNIDILSSCLLAVDEMVLVNKSKI